MPSKSKVIEIPAGKFDAVRTLRDALQRAEDGEIKTVILICAVGVREEDDDASDIWATWSEMKRHEVLWCQRWFNSWLNKRYFGDYHRNEEDE
jgi:hypothetical protein